MLIRRTSQAPIVGPAVGVIDPPWPNRLMFSGYGSLRDSSISDDTATGLKILAGMVVVGGLLLFFGHSKK